jgi:hypothetical protein
MSQISFVKLYNENYSNIIKIAINNDEYNDNSVLSKILQFDDKFFKKNELKCENGIVIRSLINYNINIEQWTSFIKAKKIGIDQLNHTELNNLYTFLSITGGSEKLWNQLYIINKKNRIKIFYDNLGYIINPTSQINDKFKIYKKWAYYFRGAIQIKDDNWIKGNFNRDVGFHCALKYTQNELNDHIDRIKKNIIKEFELNNIELPESIFLKQYDYKLKLLS